MNIAIVDDSKTEAEVLLALLREYAESGSIDINTHYYKCAEDFLAVFSPEKYNVIFMDIYMGKMTGIEAAAKIKESGNKPLLVFLSQSEEHMAEALHNHAYDYVIKPITKEKLTRLMDDITAKLSTVISLSQELSFVSEKIEYRIPFEDIAYVKSEKHYLEIGTISGTTYRTRMTFSEVSDQLLSDKRFLSTLRGIIVNMDYIKNIKDGICNLENGMIVPVNVKNSKKYEQFWQTYMFNKIKFDKSERLKNYGS